MPVDIRTHANAVNVAGSVTVRDQNVTVKKTADVQKWKNSHNVNHQTFNNYQCVSATSTAAHDPALNKFFRSLTRFFESSPQYEQDHGDDSPLSEGIPNKPDSPETEGPRIAALLDYLSPRGIDTLSKDIEQCSSPLIVSSERVIQRLSSLTRNDTVRNWLRESSEASAVLIHGRGPANNPISPLSYLCAQMSNKYTGRPGHLVLSHFCSLHKDSNPATMMSLLIKQLLSDPSVQPYFEFASIEKHKKDIKKKNLDVLCRVFRMLITQLLPSNMVVFCLIDSISYYEVPVHRAQTRTILAMMESLVRAQRARKREPHHKMVFKLMVTDGARSVVAHRHFKDHQKVEMPGAGNGSRVMDY